MAINRLEYEAQRCLKELTNQQSSQINLPYLLNGKHIEFMVTREEVRITIVKLHDLFPSNKTGIL